MSEPMSQQQGMEIIRLLKRIEEQLVNINANTHQVIQNLEAIENNTGLSKGDVGTF